MIEPGSSAAPGATVDDGGTHFAVYSSVAEAVELCLFDADGRETGRHTLPDCTDNVWHGFLPGCSAGQRYGYRVQGPFVPEEGLRCNPAKLLIDPYARQLSGDFEWHKSVFGNNDLDSAAHVPKSVVTGVPEPLHGRPCVPWSETIFYEANVRGFTMQHPQVDMSDRGRFAGMRNAQVLEYLKSLGITSVELMPVHAFIDEHHLAKRGLRNFWGYNSISFFAPANRYAGDDPVGEFREMVDAIHDAGLEVILDVVYNHTGEADSNGPTLSFRGLDNRAYYRLEPDRADVYVNDTGCGNTLDADSGVVQQLIIDSLRYWSTSMGVDGFRFDLASILGRHAAGFSSDHSLLRAIANDAVLRDRKLVAEPWDPGPGGYQLGQFPPGWAEWNDRSRDAMRAYWRGDNDTVRELARRIHGSSDLFEHNGRSPFASVDFVTSHDGFTLNDLVSYEHRHNDANGENNKDGHSHNLSCNYGVEGPTDDEGILSERRRHRLNLVATLLYAQGTPMLLAGDEFGNSQGGNNNAYAQDNETGWLDWTGLQKDVEFVKTVRNLIWARRNGNLFRIDAHVHGTLESDEGVVRNTWINADGSERQGDDWNDERAFGFMIARDPESMLLLINASNEEREFVLPVLPGGWQVAASTSGQLSPLLKDSLGRGCPIRHPVVVGSGLASVQQANHVFLADAGAFLVGHHGLAVSHVA